MGIDSEAHKATEMHGRLGGSGNRAEAVTRSLVLLRGIGGSKTERRLCGMAAPLVFTCKPRRHISEELVVPPSQEFDPAKIYEPQLLESPVEAEP